MGLRNRIVSIEETVYSRLSTLSGKSLCFGYRLDFRRMSIGNTDFITILYSPFLNS
jgi:hypothetical protein